MLSPMVGGGEGGGKVVYPREIEWEGPPPVGILTLRVPQGPKVGNLTWPPSWKTERNWKWLTFHLANTQKSPEANDLRFSSRQRKVRKSVLFFFIYEPSLLLLYDRMFTNRTVFVPSVSLGLLFVLVFMFMNVLRDAWLHSKANYYACFLCSVWGSW